MSFPLPEKFKPGTPLRDMVTTEIMQTVAGILNHIVIEEVEGLTHPQILKTAQPGRDTPWRIQIPPAPDIELSNNAPPADGGNGSAGSSPLAARGDHQHPGNYYPYTPPRDGGSPGSSSQYARGDHSHQFNGSNVTPLSLTGGASGEAGTSSYYSRADHRHAIGPAFFYGTSTKDLLAQNEGGVNTSQLSWQSDGQQALNITVLTRIRYDHTADVPRLDAYYRQFQFNAMGALAAVSSEGRFTVEVPSSLIIAT